MNIRQASCGRDHHWNLIFLANLERALSLSEKRDNRKTSFAC